MFKRRKKTTDKPQRPGLLQVAAARLNIAQRRLADWMQAKTRHWQPKQQKRFLFILCLVMGSYSTMTLVRLFKGTPTGTTSYGLKAPQPLPPLIHQLPEPAMPVAADTAVFRRFRAYVDSLLTTPEGKQKFDSYIQKRPGFMDSLAFAERMAQQNFIQQKK